MADPRVTRGAVRQAMDEALRGVWAEYPVECEAALDAVMALLVGEKRASGPVVDDPSLEIALAERNIRVGSYDPPSDAERRKDVHARVERVEEAPPCE